MKRYAILVTLLVAILMPANSQGLGKRISKGFKDTIDLLDQDVHPTGEHGRYDMLVKPVVGVVASDMTGVGGDIKVGMIGGANIEWFVLPNLAVDFEINFEKLGSNNVIHSDGYGNSASYDYRLLYLSSNYFARWYPIKERPLSLYSGLQVKRLLKAKADNGYTVSDIKDNIRKGDISIPVGIGYEVGQWQADLRYSFGITRLASNDKARNILGHAHIHELSLTLGYRIQLW